MFNVTILVSGSGTNMDVLCEAAQNGGKFAVNMVIADRKCTALDKAEKRNIPTICCLRKIHKQNLSAEIARLIPSSTNLIVLAGFLSIIREPLLNLYSKRMINLHPSLLPAYGGLYGRNVHKSVLESGETESGCTVHYVDAGIDTGDIIAQQTIPVYPKDTPESLASRLQPVEHILLKETVDRLRCIYETVAGE